MSWYQIDFLLNSYSFINGYMLNTFGSVWQPPVLHYASPSKIHSSFNKFLTLSLFSCVSYKFLKALLHMKEYCIYILISSLVFRLFSPIISVSLLFLTPFHSSTSPKNPHILKWILHKVCHGKKFLYLW